jgi:hypothetical protein
MFPDTLLCAIGAWQRGWREDQNLRESLSLELQAEAQALPRKFREVNSSVYRKRFIHKGELEALILNDKRDEGIASWTTNRAFAERFKDLSKPGAVSGVIFRHFPTDDEIILNIEALWQDSNFIAAANAYRNSDGINADALFNFADTQGEVVLRVPLRATEIIAFTGASSPFDDLCDQAGIPDSKRDKLFRELTEAGVYPGEYQYTSEEAAQRIISNTIKKTHEKISSAALILRSTDQLASNY